MSRLQVNLLTILFLAVSINFLTLMTISNNTVLHVAMSEFNANERLNSGAKVIFRDEVEGITRGETLDDFSNRQIAELMELFELRGLARETVYRPGKTGFDDYNHEPFEISVAVSHRSRFLLFSEITITAFQDEIIQEKVERVVWLFRWHRYWQPEFRSG